MAKTKKVSAPVVVDVAKADVDAMRAWFLSLVAPVKTFFEGRYLWLGLLPVGVWFWMDRALVKTWLGLILALVILTAIAVQVRKIIMPRIDIQAAAEKAQEDPVGAALVFLGGVFFMIAFIVVGALWLGGLKG
jgi:hypothetical protein